ncbi:MAG TPA: serine/threonine-protein kinase [Kofleriaceae bacterium]|nr:serine/threonine-protein kinase [Kofleriaceae bacterium]
MKPKDSAGGNTLPGAPDTLSDRESQRVTAQPESIGEAPTLPPRSGLVTIPERLAVPLAPFGEAATALGPRNGAEPIAGEPVTPSGGRSIPREVDGSRYRVGGRIGLGGMGEVLSAFDEQIGREVAVKRMRSELASGDALARFVREARVQGRLEHPAVVPVHDLAIDAAGRPFFVMKRLSGTTMTDVLTSALSVPDPSAIRKRLWRAFVDVCLAVEFAHQKRIIHRDLKPANIMLGDFGEVYVLDWGVARAVGAPMAEPFRPSRHNLNDPPPAAAHPLASATPAGDSNDLALDSGETRAGTVLGTPGYMAPEQIDGEGVGPAADIYALGCILYEISAGKPLHPRGYAAMASTAAGTMDARPSRQVTDSPPELDAICLRATALNPADRFATARELGDAVQAFLDGDRDLETRRKLAAEHVAQARAALAAGNDQEARRTAMRAAGRALALDPTARAAADLVTHLMLEPPTEVPAEVEARIEEIDTETARAQGRIAAQSLFGYLAFLPILLWTGVHNWVIVAAFLSVAVASAVQIWTLTRRHRISTRGIYLNVCINAVLIGLVSRICGPFFVAPTLVATTLMAYAAHPRFGRIFIVSAILAASIFVPWGLELIGVLEPTYRFMSGALVLTSPVIAFRALPIQIAFAISLLALLGVVAVLSRMMADRQRAAARKLEIAAWHMRQLVPHADDAAASSKLIKTDM